MSRRRMDPKVVSGEPLTGGAPWEKPAVDPEGVLRVDATGRVRVVDARHLDGDVGLGWTRPPTTSTGRGRICVFGYAG